MRNTLIFFLIISAWLVNGQNLKTLRPTLGSENKFTTTDSEYWKSAIDSLAISNNYENGINYSDMTEKTKKAIDSLEMFQGPLTQTVACSWYCGGGPYKTSSSSILNGNAKYSDENAHDFDLLTACIPKSENGIGESISFHFKSESPRLNAIIIYNGYIKSTELWNNNARVKKIKLKVDNKVIAFLKLENTTASQRFEIAPIQSTIKNQDLVLTLEIIESYKGEKYDDLAMAISEINFDGIDVH